MAFTALVLSWMVRSRWARRVMDSPNERSLHSVPVPRTGGLALVGGILLGWLSSASTDVWTILIPFLCLALISFIDDWRGIPVPVRLLAHVAAAAWCALALTHGTLAIVEFVVVVLALVWMINLFNFMDGADGLAGGMTLFGFLFLGIMAFLGKDYLFASLNVIVASVALVFLLFNSHPARIFMGDVGSIPLGFLAAATGLAGYLKDLWPAWFPLLVFSPFIVDASITLLKRLSRREKVWQAHRDHYYQRLVLLGYGHRKTAWLEYSLMIAVGISAIYGVHQTSMSRAVLLGGWIIVYLILMYLIDRRWKKA